MSFLRIVSTCTVLLLVAMVHGQRWGYYGGYSWYGGQWGCNGNWYNPVCPDRSSSPANCANNPNLTCPTINNLAYSCISPGICCPTATNTSVCPTGLFSGERCNFGFCRRSGLQCFNGLCCLGTTSGNCLDGNPGVGTCIINGTTLNCGPGFNCQTVGGQNLCCNSTSATTTTNTGGCVPRGGGCTSTIQCNNGRDGYRCQNGRCCQLPNTRSASNANVEKVCPKGDPFGACNVTAPACPRGKCSKKGFCCED